MSVSNGQPATAQVFNGGFISKLVDSTTIARITLNRSGSGAQIADVQQKINDDSVRITAAEGNISTLQGDVSTLQTDVSNLQIATPQVNFSAAVNPTSTNDVTEGYQIGSRWINISNNSVWTAVDVTTGAAIWKRNDKERFAVSFFTTLNMSTTNITDGAYVQLVADTGAEEVRKVNVFYPAGSILIFALGSASSEVNEFLMQPGGGVEEVSIPPNSRVSLRLVTGQTAVTSGVLAVNFLTEV